MPATEALAFDLYGTLVDPIRISWQLAEYLGDRATRAAKVWRQKQLEYTFRLTAMGHYEDFEQVTRKALDYALAVVGLDLTAEQRRQLMHQYDRLESFPDVHPGLTRLKEAGYTMAVFSNGTPRMVKAAVQSAGLESMFDDLISVDVVNQFKPAAAVYQRAAARLGRPLGQVRLVSSNPFDVIGAEAAGMQVTWINRSGGLFDTLGPRPALVVETLTELADRLQQRT